MCRILFSIPEEEVEEDEEEEEEVGSTSQEFMRSPWLGGGLRGSWIDWISITNSLLILSCEEGRVLSCPSLVVGTRYCSFCCFVLTAGENVFQSALSADIAAELQLDEGRGLNVTGSGS